MTTPESAAAVLADMERLLAECHVGDEVGPEDLQRWIAALRAPVGVDDAMIVRALMAPYRDGNVSDMLRGGGDEETAIIRAALTAARVAGVAQRRSGEWFGSAVADRGALELARLFTTDDEPQKRARLQVAIIDAIYSTTIAPQEPK